MDRDRDISQDEFDELSNLDVTVLMNKHHWGQARDNMNGVEMAVTYVDRMIYETAAVIRDTVKNIGALALRGVNKSTSVRK